MALRLYQSACVVAATFGLEVLGATPAAMCATGSCQAESPDEEHSSEEVGLLQVPRSQQAHVSAAVKASSVASASTANASAAVQTAATSNSSWWSNCVYESFAGKDALKHVQLGRADNMDPQLAALGIDLTGMWWMRGNPVEEVLASFVGTKVNSSTFPARLSVPNSMANHWSWRNSAMGTSLMKFYSVQSLGYTPEGAMGIEMFNDTDGHIDTALKTNPAVLVEAWGFHKLNEDEWNRTSTFQDKSVWEYISGDHWYVLTRILKADGTPTKFWNDYLQSEDGKAEQRTFITNNACLRSCRISVPSCSVCNFACGTR